MHDYNLAVLAYTGNEPVTVAEARLHLRVDSTDEDVALAGLIAVARETAESQTGRQYRSARLLMTLDRFPCPIRLPRGPLLSVISVVYIDSAGDLQTLAADSYKVSTAMSPAAIVPVYGTLWPVTRCEIEAVQVTYTAGYAIVPESVKLAILQAVAFLYEHRGDDEGAMAYLPRLMSQLLLTTWDGHYH